ncbi:MAG: biopolymer transporter ExbD [Elusimicrobiales bacterium]|jgi:biopolymer transport protein ExbD|nr:biopolymer transporter ExbD [Elusimicrobiales bacterium]NLH39240.1 biopolymer transporter ExbD [Elusimicrobiota bacterium]
MQGKDSSQSSEPITEINLTPLVDISLVLVIIFMVVAPFALQTGIKVLQSKPGASTGKASMNDVVQITISKENRIKINNQEITIEELPSILSQAISESAEKMVVVSADDENSVGQVVTIMDEAKQLGALKIALMKTGGSSDSGEIRGDLK